VNEAENAGIAAVKAAVIAALPVWARVVFYAGFGVALAVGVVIGLHTQQKWDSDAASKALMAEQPIITKYVKEIVHDQAALPDVRVNLERMCQSWVRGAGRADATAPADPRAAEAAAEAYAEADQVSGEVVGAIQNGEQLEALQAVLKPQLKQPKRWWEFWKS